MLCVFAGLGLGLSLIDAIGAQNVFVLRQGIRREHGLPVVIICALSDALLIAAGVAGLAF
ncbi:LysE family transporter, partial [Halomonas sp. SIMBA_159]